MLTSAKPFIVPMRGTSAAHISTHGVDEALSTISAGGTHHALVQPVATPFLTECANGSSQRNFDVQEPLRTQVAQVKGGHFAMVAGHLTHLTHHGDRSGYDRAVHTQPQREKSITDKVNCGPTLKLRIGNEQGFALAFACKPLILNGAEAGIEPFSLSLKIKENFKFENFSTSMCTLSMRDASVMSVATCLH